MKSFLKGRMIPFHGDTVDDQDAYVIAAALAVAGAAWR
jgi:hypothetical protein